MKSNTLPQPVHAAFEKHVFTPSENRALEKMYDHVFHAVERVLRKYRQLPATVREDVVAKALVSGLAYGIALNGAIPKRAEDWAGLACWKAARLALDAIRAQQRDPLVLTLDAAVENEEGEAFAEAPVLVRHAYNRWRAAQAETAYDELVDQTRGALRGFLTDHCSARTAAIFWARVMDGWALEDVCRTYHASADDVYVTVCRVKKAWVRHGRDYYRAA